MCKSGFADFVFLQDKAPQNPIFLLKPPYINIYETISSVGPGIDWHLKTAHINILFPSNGIHKLAKWKLEKNKFKETILGFLFFLGLGNGKQAFL